MRNLFKNCSANISNRKWKNIISRNMPLYDEGNDIRNEFERDYTRVIHSAAYRRLKHKTQVFFSPNNDHICTRIEHVMHVESISYIIANYMGLNTDLTRAIATSHDLGHSPFGHVGEKILSNISKRDLDTTFWHEKNGLDMVDFIELLEDHERFKQNLNLTYGVRDGIISHCGEIDENAIRPRKNFISLSNYCFPNQFMPYTWEACVVKIADKISYIGRDIEDAITLGILDNHLNELYDLLDLNSSNRHLNNSVIIKYLISDLCENSSPEKGLCFSDDAFDLLNKVKAFNYKNIYLSDKILPSNRYFNLVINEIYDTFKSCYDNQNLLNCINNLNKFCPNASKDFYSFLCSYFDCGNRDTLKLKNKIIFDFCEKSDFYRAILYYISGMTDNFAIDVYNEIIGF